MTPDLSRLFADAMADLEAAITALNDYGPCYVRRLLEYPHHRPSPASGAGMTRRLESARQRGPA